VATVATSSLEQIGVKNRLDFPDHVCETLRFDAVESTSVTEQKAESCRQRLEEEQRQPDIVRQKQLTNLRHERLTHEAMLLKTRISRSTKRSTTSSELSETETQEI
jgi:hypothetical protein